MLRVDYSKLVSSPALPFPPSPSPLGRRQPAATIPRLTRSLSPSLFGAKNQSARLGRTEVCPGSTFNAVAVYPAFLSGRGKFSFCFHESQWKGKEALAKAGALGVVGVCCDKRRLKRLKHSCFSSQISRSLDSKSSNWLYSLLEEACLSSSFRLQASIFDNRSLMGRARFIARHPRDRRTSRRALHLHFKKGLH
ncbi:hypothetical protein VNO78_02840 [Psophocarpus tetragonolobus]|uniref:Uncharacterized protein n=1 Tax=Psophocarpus tetragonolobus TaxID=3891 RepID=A0AAN9XW17_PSOTE